MSRSSVLVWICGAVALGCAPPREFVFVDLDRAVAADSSVAPTLSERSPPLDFESVSTQSTLPSVPGRPVADAGAAQRLAAAQAELAEQRTLVAKNLGDQLLRALSKEIERFRLEENAKIEGRLEQRFAQLSEEVAVALNRYADARWPVANRLALLVGYPFPAEKLIPQPDPEDRIATRFYREAVDLFGQLRALESEYRSAVDAILSNYFEFSSKERLDLGLQIVEKLDQAERKAREDAQRAISSVNQSVDVSLSNLARIQLAPIASNRSVVEQKGYVVHGGIGKVESNASIIPIRERVEADLAIWLKVNRYRRSTSEVRVRDATENFIEWRRTMRSIR